VAWAGVILPPDCTSGAGSSLGTVVTATNLTGLQPYTLYALNPFTVNFTFFPPGDVIGGILIVNATILLGDIPVTTAIATAEVGNFFVPRKLVLGIWIPFTTIDITLAIALGTMPPYTVGLTFDVPRLANISAVFEGTVIDAYTNVILCKQGMVNLIE